MTWLLVSTRPSGLITMPVAAACSLLYCSVVLMMTRPGATLFTMACSPALVLGLLALGIGTALLGSGAGFSAPLLGCGDAPLPLVLAGGDRSPREPASTAPGASGPG